MTDRPIVNALMAERQREWDKEGPRESMLRFQVHNERRFYPFEIIKRIKKQNQYVAVSVGGGPPQINQCVGNAAVVTVSG